MLMIGIFVLMATLSIFPPVPPLFYGRNFLLLILLCKLQYTRNTS